MVLPDFRPVTLILIWPYHVNRALRLPFGFGIRTPLSMDRRFSAQGNMRPAGPEIMLRKYAQVVTSEMHGVQVRWFESCGLGVGQNLLAQNAGSDAIQ